MLYAKWHKTNSITMPYSLHAQSDRTRHAVDMAMVAISCAASVSRLSSDFLGVISDAQRPESWSMRPSPLGGVSVGITGRFSVFGRSYQLDNEIGDDSGLGSGIGSKHKQPTANMLETHLNELNSDRIGKNGTENAERDPKNLLTTGWSHAPKTLRRRAVG